MIWSSASTLRRTETAKSGGIRLDGGRIAVVNVLSDADVCVELIGDVLLEIEPVEDERHDRHDAIIHGRREPGCPSPLGLAGDDKVVDGLRAVRLARDERLRCIHGGDRAFHHGQQNRPILSVAVEELVQRVGHERVLGQRSGSRETLRLVRHRRQKDGNRIGRRRYLHGIGIGRGRRRRRVIQCLFIFNVEHGRFCGDIRRHDDLQPMLPDFRDAGRRVPGLRRQVHHIVFIPGTSDHAVERVPVRGIGRGDVRIQRGNLRWRERRQCRGRRRQQQPILKRLDGGDRRRMKQTTRENCEPATRYATQEAAMNMF